MTKIAYLTTGVMAGVLISAFSFSALSDTKTLDPAKLNPGMYKIMLENKNSERLTITSSRANKSLCTPIRAAYLCISSPMRTWQQLRPMGKVQRAIIELETSSGATQ